jgi:hypothetical protein
MPERYSTAERTLKKARNVHRKKNIEHISSVAAIKKAPVFTGAKSG